MTYLSLPISSESIYQTALEQVLGGTHMRMGIYGISDITTDQFHAEIKTWPNWRTMLSQLLIYNMASFRIELRAYVFGERPKTYTDDDMKSVLNVFAKYDITMYHATIMSENQIRITNLSTLAISDYAFGVPISITLAQKLSDDEKAQIDNFALNANPTMSFVVNIEEVAKLLQTRKGNLVKTLKNSYAQGIDYSITNNTINGKPGYVGRGKNTVRHVFVTQDCFKELCMQSHTERAALVRTYFMHDSKNRVNGLSAEEC